MNGDLHPAEPRPTKVPMDYIRNNGAGRMRLLPRTFGCILWILTLVSGVVQASCSVSGHEGVEID